MRYVECKNNNCMVISSLLCTHTDDINESNATIKSITLRDPYNFTKDIIVHTCIKHLNIG